MSVGKIKRPQSVKSNRKSKPKSKNVLNYLLQLDVLHGTIDDRISEIYRGFDIERLGDSICVKRPKKPGKSNQ